MVIVWCGIKVLHRLFWIMRQGVSWSGKTNLIKRSRSESDKSTTSVRDAVLNRRKSLHEDPKPGDLGLGRVKSYTCGMEARRVSVSIPSSDLGLGAKNQSCPAIAGSHQIGP